MLRFATAAVILLSIAATTSAQLPDPLHPAQPELVRAELLCDAASIQPGSTVRVGVHLVIKDGWHVNWINPGDAGLAPSIKWMLPAGFKAGIVQWPLPERFAAGPLVIFGYGGDVLLVSDLRVPADATAGGNVDIAADVSWLACAGECVPGSASVKLTLPVEKVARPNAATRSLFDVTEARWPGHSLAWKMEAWVEQQNTLVLEVQSGDANGGALQDLFFFPYDPGLFENAAPQALSAHPGPGGSVYQLRIARAHIPAAELTRVYGLLVASSGLSRASGPAAIEVDVPVTRR